MKYLTACYTDQGKRKEINQDSMLISQARFAGQEVVLAVVCDGMGGLKNGELASAEVIRSFSLWFREEFGQLMFKSKTEMSDEQEIFEDVLYDAWEVLLQTVHRKLREYGQLQEVVLGTTITAMLLWRENYYIVHVGDTRAYVLTDKGEEGSVHIVQLTQDQIVAELDAGTTGKTKKNVLIQGVGASRIIRPIYYSGKIAANAVYLLCSDGFRHKINNREIQERFMPERLTDEKMMVEQAQKAVQLVMKRGEKDNISVILVRTVQEHKKCTEKQTNMAGDIFAIERERIFVHDGEEL